MIYAEERESDNIKIAVIDADLIGRSKHRFPNLACMKISAYYKSLGYKVDLKLDYENLDVYDKVIISKVFLDTTVNKEILKLHNVEYGGTGFFYDKAPPLPYEIEHIMPDYHLYDKWIEQKLSEGVKPKELTYYTDWSVGFATRGCIRQCSFCVNKNYKSCNLHSNLDEFVDKDRKYICLLDDNVLACNEWKKVFDDLKSTGKRFQFKQGCDERLLTDEKCETLFSAKWIGDYIFAFDNIKDKELIERKLQLIRKYTGKKTIKFYVFCAYNHEYPDMYNLEFWKNDIQELFERIKILMKYDCKPYIMRYKDYKESPYYGTYINIASWCNQPNLFKKMSYKEWCVADNKRKGGSSATIRYFNKLKADYPEIAKEYFDIKYEELKSV